MTPDLRCGRWQDTMADVDTCHTTIGDGPYSYKTHRGHNEGADQARGATGQKVRRDIGYEHFKPADVRELVNHWSKRATRWLVFMTDDVLAPVYQRAYEDEGFYAFPIVPMIVHRPRLLGDGPSCAIICVMVARPRTKAAMRWRCTPGWYPPTTRQLSPVVGNKSEHHTGALVRDYSNPGDLVVDPFGGSFTTALMCSQLGRRCISSEMDAETFALGKARVERGVQADMFGGAA